MLNSKIYKENVKSQFLSGKKQTTKKLFAFIIMVFSVSLAEAQCICYCAPHPKKNAECYTKSDGTLACRNSRCRDRIGFTTTHEGTALDDIYPNPVSSSTNVSFFVGQSENVSLQIFDVNGRLVVTLVNAPFEEGDYEIIWNAAEANAGIYFLRMETGSYSENQKLIVTK